MMRRSGFAVIACALVLGQSGIAFARSSPLDALKRPGPNVSVVRGKFDQDKYLSELEHPLQSSGRFTLVRDRGLIWRIQQPIESTLVVTRNRLQTRKNGQTERSLTTSDQPGLRVVSAVLLAVFNADIDRLKQYFNVATQATDNNHWRIDLTPKKAGIKRVLKHAQLTGKTHVQTITLDQPGGDRTVIHLTLLPNTPNRLKTHERQLLNGR